MSLTPRVSFAVESSACPRAASSCSRPVRDPPREQLGDRRVLDARVAHVPGHDPAQPIHVQPELLARRPVTVDVCSLPAEDRPRGVARQRLGGGEDDERDQEQREHAQAQPYEEESDKRRQPALRLLRRDSGSPAGRDAHRHLTSPVRTRHTEQPTLKPNRLRHTSAQGAHSTRSGLGRLGIEVHKVVTPP